MSRCCWRGRAELAGSWQLCWPQDAASCPNRLWGLFLRAVPCARDRSCFEGKSCQSGLVCSTPVGLEGCGCWGTRGRCLPPAPPLAPRPGSRGRAPRSGCRTPQHQAGSRAGGKPRARCLTSVARAGRGAAGLPVHGAVPGLVPRPCAPQAGAAAAPPAPHALPEPPCVLVHLFLCSAGCYATAGS